MNDGCYITDTHLSISGLLIIYCCVTILHLSSLKQPFYFAYDFVDQNSGGAWLVLHLLEYLGLEHLLLRWLINSHVCCFCAPQSLSLSQPPHAMVSYSPRSPNVVWVSHSIFGDQRLLRWWLAFPRISIPSNSERKLSISEGLDL